MNEFSGNALDGFFAEANSGVIMFDQIVNSVFDGNGDDGLDLQTTNGGTLTVADTLTGNTYNGNDDNGIELTGGIGGMLVVDIGDPLLGSTSPLTGNGGAGLFIGTVGGTLMTSLRGVTSENNIGSGATRTTCHQHQPRFDSRLQSKQATNGVAQKRHNSVLQQDAKQHRQGKLEHPFKVQGQ